MNSHFHNWFGLKTTANAVIPKSMHKNNANKQRKFWGGKEQKRQTKTIRANQHMQKRQYALHINAKSKERKLWNQDKNMPAMVPVLLEHYTLYTRIMRQKWRILWDSPNKELQISRKLSWLTTYSQFRKFIFITYSFNYVCESGPPHWNTQLERLVWYDLHHENNNKKTSLEKSVVGEQLFSSNSINF